jgi:hypothetical protein
MVPQSLTCESTADADLSLKLSGCLAFGRVLVVTAFVADRGLMFKMGRHEKGMWPPASKSLRGLTPGELLYTGILAYAISEADQNQKT